MAATIDRLEIEIQAQASAANKQLDALARKLDKVGVSLKNIDTSRIGKIGNNLGGVTPKVNGASKAFRKLNNAMGSFATTTKSADRSTRSLASTFGSFYANCFLLIRGVKALGRATQKSMDYIETFNYYNVTMDKIGKQFGSQFEKYGYENAGAYADSFKGRLNDLTTKMSGFNVGEDGVMSFANNKNLSLDPELIMSYQANIASVTNSVGLIGETSVNAGKALSMLAADMSSLKNIDLKTVMTNFQSGLIGQSRALYKYGIDITNATLQTYAYKHGLNMAVQEMTQSDKMQLRLIAILDQSKVAWGDQANTISSVANQYRILKQQISNVARMIGNLLMPVLQVVLPFINGLLIALQKLIVFVGKLLGIDYSKIMDGISGGYGGGDDALGDLVDDADNMGDSLGSAEQAAKKLQRTLLGFDQINKLNDEPEANQGTGAGGAGGAGSVDLSGAIGDLLGDYESIWEKALKDSENKAQAWADRICDVFNQLRIAAEPTTESIKKLWNEGLSKLGNFTLDTLKDFWNNLLKPMGAWMLGDNAGLPRFFNITNALLNEIDWNRLQSSLSDFYQALQKPTQFVWTGLMDFYESFLKPVAVWTMSEAIPQLVDALTEFANTIHWEEINASLKNFWEALAPFAKGVGQGLINFFKGLLEVGADFINKVVPGGLNGMADALKKIEPETAERIGEAIGKIGLALLVFKGIGGIVSGIAGIGTAFSGLAAGLGGIFGANGLFASIGGTISGLASKISPMLSPLSNAIATGLGGIMKTISSAFGGLSFGATFGIVLGGVALIVAGIIDLWRTSETFRDNVKNMLDIIGGAFLIAKQKIWDEGLKPLWDSIKELFGSLYEIYESSGLKSIFEAIVTGIGYIATGALGLLIIAIGDFVKFLANAIQGAVDILGKMLDYVKGFIEQHRQVFDGLKQIFKGVTEFLVGVFSGDWRRAWNGIKEIFSGVWSTFVGIVKSPINAVIGILNRFLSGVQTLANAISDALSFKVDLPDAVEKLTGMSSFGLNIPKVSIPKIPYLAKGGMVNAGQLFVAREKGPELVGMHGNKAAVINNDQLLDTARSSLKQDFAEVAAEIFMLSNGGQQNSQPPIIEFSWRTDTETLYQQTLIGKKKSDRRWGFEASF